MLYRKHGTGKHALVSRLDLVVSRLALPPAPLNGVIYVPNFHHNAGVNDRMAFGSRDVVLSYSRIFRQMRHASMDVFVRSTEGYLCSHLIKERVGVGLFDACFRRFREGSMVAIMDTQISRHAPYECISMGIKLVGEYNLTKCPGDLRDVPVSAKLSYSGDTRYFANLSSSKCTNVAFTKMIFSEGAHFSTPSIVEDKTTCHIAVASSHVVQTVPVDSWGPWKPITVRVIGGSARSLSNFMKLSFLALFPAVNHFVFIDERLQLLAPVVQLISLLSAGHHTVLYKHPCAYDEHDERVLDIDLCNYPHPNYVNWFEQEVALVMTGSRTGTHERTKRTRRLISSEPILNNNYADTALFVVQRNERSTAFFDSWNNLLIKYGIGMDRDQIALPFLRHDSGIRYYDSVPPKCTHLCSWWATSEKRVGRFKPLIDASRPKNKWLSTNGTSLGRSSS
jgi:hypothetical protein